MEGMGWMLLQVIVTSPISLVVSPPNAHLPAPVTLLRTLHAIVLSILDQIEMLSPPYDSIAEKGVLYWVPSGADSFGTQIMITGPCDAFSC